jgi:hypothetical protein
MILPRADYGAVPNGENQSPVNSARTTNYGPATKGSDTKEFYYD